MRSATKKALAITGGVAAIGAVAGAAAYTVTDLLVRVALDRDKPRILQNSEGRISGAKEESPFQTVRREASRTLESRPHEVVRINAEDGMLLAGHWFRQEGARRTIVAMHGWRSSYGMDFGMIADFWLNNGCNVLFAEQRGQNNSGGTHMGFGMTERFDCRSWVNFVNERCGTELPVYLAGVSMGAATVLMATGLTLPENVRGVMADCGFTSPHAIWEYITRKNLHMRFGLKGQMADRICRRKIHMGAADYSTVEALRTTHLPVLFIHGTDDHFVPIEMTYENYKACAGPKRLLVVPGAEHGMSYAVDREGYEKAVRDFWATYDR